MLVPAMFRAPRYFMSRGQRIASSCKSPVWVSLRWNHSKLRRYKAVIFDMGGVLIQSPYRLAAAWEQQHNLPAGCIWKAILGSGDKGDGWYRCMRGELTLKEFADLCSKEIFTGSQTPDPIGAFLSEIASHLIEKPCPAMREAIMCIRAEGLRTAVLTNNFYLHKNQSFLPVEKSLFDVIIESCREGTCKPDPMIYTRCLEHLKVRPEESIFLDDLGQNLKTASQLGMHTIKVQDSSAALQELADMLGFPLHGYVEGTRAVRQGMEIPVDKLKEYLQTALGQSSMEPLSLRQFTHGQSNPTYHLQSGDRQLVLRKKPPGKLLPSAHLVEREYRVMKALAGMGVPVPKPLALCEDPSVLGTSFYLMEYCPGRIFKDPSLPGLNPSQRREIYTAMNRTLCQIHQVNIQAAGLEDYGKYGNYIERQVRTWSKQYRASETRTIPAMERLIQWLPDHLPTQETTTVVHGDFRLDNVVFHPDKPEVLAVLDWELSTLGDPLSDVTYNCLVHHLPPDFHLLKGLSEYDLAEMGIPSDEEYLSLYCENMGIRSVENWNFYMAFAFFRIAAILQGVYKRSLQGQASSAEAAGVGKLAEEMADLAWVFATKEGFRIFKSIPTGNPGVPLRSFATWSRQSSSATHVSSSFDIKAPRHPAVAMASAPKGHLIVSAESLPVRVQELHRTLSTFMDKQVLPLEQELRDYQSSDNRWIPNPHIEELKRKAREDGLWNLFLPLEADPKIEYGAGLTNLEFAYLCEVMGRSLHAPEVFNCSAPDTGNMEVLVRYGTESQKKQWLFPLLDGKIRSCFAMTEPQVASSDATNIEASIVEDGDFYILNGHKWWTTGALDPRCKLCVFMGKTDPKAPRHRQQSMVLVSMDTPGIQVLRALSVYGMEDPPGGHGELLFENVRVPKENILLEPGRGFEIAQGRLGPGRIHHCMRLIGNAERALELMKERVKTRNAFGKPLAEQGTIMADMAHSRVEIEQARLLVLKAAHLMDTVGNKAAAPEISMIKLLVPNMALKVIDRAIQAFGGAGLSSDYPLAEYFGWARALRLADGPDEVHRTAIAKLELKR
ncbi:acyl-CoA dehydrogenase family member 10 [Callorhinchus milii]|uniref:Acyl-CoA dehydrogenase family member 10 n=1 Tax=Callorhinchus milii TaxID=7868 RepID=A0A4W3K453_CALMI|nr:acyl-CoA dehydrogenase family member 10 [Callorhinchus milii]XP_042193345.1 acyl-CoA dehydrogenase family member 10 [Callorhinchus milii]XP_042193346.1 acyl-CoA dehydrogenase family member 10 [Callorhinchus milii]XP_042193347.1 acyl-CoA dehydrogenase family member 10 [Callorhinchus milii]XP_042193348.1 acyl-CoA dehydrogenase family member 10 [Callorhinchus milii]|eukprot:gi/632967625/ref/XP_007900081.1/ PREDICTED: acyl-CoA dehydrogenase family member 10 [Callorhinchus milii]